MLTREELEPFLNKRIIFFRKDPHGETFLRGLLVKISDTGITILFNGEPQVYSLECLLAVKLDRKEAST